VLKARGNIVKLYGGYRPWHGYLTIRSCLSPLSIPQNTADVSCPQDVPILRPENVEDQLCTAAVVFLENQLSVDVIRRCVLLPKVCEVYKNDFDDEASGCLYYCSRYLDLATVTALKKMLKEEATLTIKYQPSADQYHTKLVLRRDPEQMPSPAQQQQQEPTQQQQQQTPTAPPATPPSHNWPAQQRAENEF